MWTHRAKGRIPLRLERTVWQQAEGEGIEVIRVEPPGLMQVLPAQKIRPRWQQVPFCGCRKPICHVVDREGAVRRRLSIRCTSTSTTRLRARPGRLDDYDAGKLIGTDIVVVDQILQGPAELLWASVDLLLAEDDDGDDLVRPDALLDAALHVCQRCCS